MSRARVYEGPEQQAGKSLVGFLSAKMRKCKVGDRALGFEGCWGALVLAMKEVGHEKNPSFHVICR